MKKQEKINKDKEKVKFDIDIDNLPGRRIKLISKKPFYKLRDWQFDEDCHLMVPSTEKEKIMNMPYYGIEFWFAKRKEK